MRYAYMPPTCLKVLLDLTAAQYSAWMTKLDGRIFFIRNLSALHFQK